MADNNPDDDIYDDPDTIGDVDDDVTGQPDDLPPANPTDPSQSIYTPEENTTELDDRPPIDEIEASDASDVDTLEERDPTADPALLDDDAAGLDPDDYHQRQDVPQDEKDSTFDNE